MNPASASVPTTQPRMVNDIAGPPPKAPEPMSAVMAAPNLVDSIPVHSQVSQAPPVNEDDELDKIMQDVGQEMKKDAEKPRKHGFLHFGHKPKQKAVTSAQPLQPAPAAPPTGNPSLATPAAPTAIMAAALPPQPIVQPAAPAPATAAKPKKTSSAPVFAIFVCVLATCFLVAAAIAAYRQ